MSDLHIEEIMAVVRYAQNRANEDKCNWHIVAVSSCIFASANKNSGRIIETVVPVIEKSAAFTKHEVPHG